MSKSFSNRVGRVRRRASNRILDQRGMREARRMEGISNALSKRHGTPLPSGMHVVCGCGDLSCVFFSPDRKPAKEGA